ncbi:unnamed protein product [Cylicocyclus nassatus]|uniref:Uncharacterized protein n=1 Tax=Cylicocyclus nassatus TaxID=53992 RepID=A0AA36M1Y7_CYLNA|nr:unnamed protein product [Cylicocyclus nassatus]
MISTRIFLFRKLSKGVEMKIFYMIMLVILMVSVHMADAKRYRKHPKCIICSHGKHPKCTNCSKKISVNKVEINVNTNQ